MDPHSFYGEAGAKQVMKLRPAVRATHQMPSPNVQNACCYTYVLIHIRIDD